MPVLVAACPRCGSSKITFDVTSALPTNIMFGWQTWYEVFAVCRLCERATIFEVAEREANDHYDLERDGGLLKVKAALNKYLEVKSFVGLKDMSRVSPPEHLPKNIEAVFKEGATCLAVGCWNAAGTMFRLCVDMATKPLLPETDADGLNSKIRRDLGLRLPWLFANGHLPLNLKDLATCIKNDGNDGAHEGTLSKADANDMLEFTTLLLERLFTEKKRLELAEARRTERRIKKK